MELAQDRIAGDVAQGAGDLAGGQTFLPKRFKLLDTVVRPTRWKHTQTSAMGGRILSDSLTHHAAQSEPLTLYLESPS